MEIKIRYKLWQVVLGFIGLGFLMAMLYFLTQSDEGSKEVVKETAKPRDHPYNSGLSTLFYFVYLVLLFYGALNFYYYLIAGNKKLVSYLRATAIIVAGAFIYHCFLYFFVPQALKKSYDSPLQLFFTVVRNMIPMLILSILVAYFTVLQEALKQRRILEAQKMELELQISQANFNFLKAQINPHFLHNTLNFLYAKSLPYSAELSEGILTLSDIMRYALNQGNLKDGKVPLKDEIEHVHNVVKISQLRYSNQLNVHFAVTGTVEGALIIPFVLITLVENAFKHGDLKNQEHPIDIRLDVNTSRLYFYCRNRKKSGPKDLSTGIGLENIRKRLDMAYGNHYTFRVNDEREFYTTELIIDKL